MLSCFPLNVQATRDMKDIASFRPIDPASKFLRHEELSSSTSSPSSLSKESPLACPKPQRLNVSSPEHKRLISQLSPPNTPKIISIGEITYQYNSNISLCSTSFSFDHTDPEENKQSYNKICANPKSPASVLSDRSSAFREVRRTSEEYDFEEAFSILPPPDKPLLGSDLFADRTQSNNNNQIFKQKSCKSQIERLPYCIKIPFIVNKMSKSASLSKKNRDNSTQIKTSYQTTEQKSQVLEESSNFMSEWLAEKINTDTVGCYLCSTTTEI